MNKVLDEQSNDTVVKGTVIYDATVLAFAFILHYLTSLNQILCFCAYLLHFILSQVWPVMNEP